jgi:hypothetical protein
LRAASPEEFELETTGTAAENEFFPEPVAF